ncbi:unnamed protein product [Discula destructiva]
MAPKVEILVHIAAPSTSKDDALYRTFATAYLDFKPVRRGELPAVAAKEVETASPPAELVSPQASFESAWGNIGPRRAQKCAQNSSSQNEENPSQDSWVQPPSEVPDSMPDNDISLPELNSPTRLLDYFLQTGGPPSEPSEESRRRDSSVYEGGHNLTALLARGTASIIQGDEHVATPRASKTTSSQHTVYEGGADVSALLVRGPNSILQDEHVCPRPTAADLSPSDARYGTPPNASTAQSRMDESHVSQTPSSPLRSKGAPPPPPVRSYESPQAWSFDAVRTSQQSRSDLVGVTIPATQLPERADSEPPSSKRFKPNSLQKHAHGFLSATSEVLPRISKVSHVPPQALLLSKDLSAGSDSATPTINWDRHTHLNSSEPPPSTHRIGARVPLMLEKLMHDMGDRYRPTFPGPRSTMREHERGYWLLPVVDWPHEDRLSAWGFLGNYICRDRRAGWGTRACRDGGWTWLRLYGWEHIAGELYVLLYMASLRRLKAMEVAWYDGAGELLIVVAARSEKSACWDRARRVHLECGELRCGICGEGHA